MNLRNPAAAAVAALALAGGLTTTTAAAAAAVPASTPKVIQNCGKARACASHRPRAFQLSRHTRITDIKWRRYTPTRAVGLGWFGHAKHVCNDRVPAAEVTCVVLVFSSPVTREHVRYYNRLQLRPATMFSNWRWSWHTASWKNVGQ
jgi:hypothetical protein